ncbi:MAG: hypothetical protein ACJA0Q_001767 [Saprospiraceae bacterium]|jgi:hypothetical protein
MQKINFKNLLCSFALNYFKSELMIRCLISGVILFLFVSCSKIDEFTQFEMDYSEQVIIPSSSGLSLPFNLYSPDVETNSESTFEVNDTRKDLIEQIKLTKLNLTLTSPSNSDFSFLKSIDIYINATGVSEVKVAWSSDIPSSNIIEMTTTDADLKEFIKKDDFTLRVNTVTDEILTSDHHIDIYSNFYVDAEVLGQ